MSVREWYAPKRTTFWKQPSFTYKFLLLVRFNVLIRCLMGTIEWKGEEYFGEAICFTGIFNSSYVTGESISIDHWMLSCCMSFIKMERINPHVSHAETIQLRDIFDNMCVSNSRSLSSRKKPLDLQLPSYFLKHTHIYIHTLFLSFSSTYT